MDPIEHAVTEAIAEVRDNAPVAPESDLDVVVEIATLKFNRLQDRTEKDFGIKNYTVLETKCEIEAEKQLGLR